MAEYQRDMLSALSLRAKDDIEYYELVTLVVLKEGGVLSYGAAAVGGGPTIRRVYLCVGKHSIVMIRRNLKKVPRGGTVRYEWIDQAVQDMRNSTEFSLSMNGKRSSDCPAQILIRSQRRSTLISKITISFLADTMLRLGKVDTLPLFEAELDVPASRIARVQPFMKYKKVMLQDYFFFINENFQEVPSTSGVETGKYMAKVVNVFGKDRLPHGEQKADIEVQMHVYDPVLNSDLGLMHREHVRWLAMEYKQAYLRTQQTYVLRNKLYLKKMNLSNDMAAWVCWELFLQDKQYFTVVILLRRQYAPPLVDTAQDFALVLRCPASNTGEMRTREFQEDLIHEAHVMADSLTPQAPNPELCTDLIQVKLDALLYDEDSYGWIRSRLKLKPDGESHMEKYAFIFVKGILKILRDENTLGSPDLWDEAEKRVEALCSKKTEQDLDPLTVISQNLSAPAEGLQAANVDEDNRTRAGLNSWRARVARFLAYCLDGGLFGSKFTLSDVITNLIQDKVSQTSTKKLAQILAFLLHLRPKDLMKAWEPKLVQHQLLAMGLLSIEKGKPIEESAQAFCTFSDRVMQALVETGYLSTLIPPSEKDGAMSPQYASCLTHLLRSDHSSINLKAAVCRQIVAASGAEHGGVLSIGLIHILREGGLFLATYATAALVNLSTMELVKNFLMSDGVELIVLEQLESKDDDLTLYTLMLMVHLTKAAGHRSVLIQRGVLQRIYQILSANYYVLDKKRRVLTELCSVLGQLCNDETTRKVICEKYQFVIDAMLQIFDTAEGLKEEWKPGEVAPTGRSPGAVLPGSSTKIISKVLFALKQLCANSFDNKDLVGARVIKAVVKDLQNKSNLQYKDWATNAILLLLLLAISSTNCQLILDAGWAQTYQDLCSSPLGKLDATRDRIQQIQDRIDYLIQDE